MRPAALFLLLLAPFSLSAKDAWLYSPVPKVMHGERAEITAKATGAAFRFPSSERSKAAWINQSDWLFERFVKKGMRIGDPIHIRIFKQSRELELHVGGDQGFRLYRTYPICEISGALGPKRFEGDYQAPEGFYNVEPERLHPNSDFHLAFNLGYPNAFDRARGRTGSNIMIHGGCASNGCFAMTDYYMEQIYLLAEAALRNGQPSIGVEIYPFRMSDENLASHSASRWSPFWNSLKPWPLPCQEMQRRVAPAQWLPLFIDCRGRRTSAVGCVALA
ncbi:MAG: 2-dehydro-3-deoxyphosphooctonate aldolase [Xanthomonadaceae bacterium]|nr:2-dehydro-3-deoxyphosphooctonate aldolase [Xanthomonadaceae bacterium]